ncbi:arachidonate 12-lipoxygenase, 12R-type-like [Pseudophryne corroboree]|uniref:arachidonate 12-lipoxygenase, 12R-type-like n=1 Tax=Pseudophryne corroboree TaxID=495146 RepID=UPI003081B4A6
MVTYKLKIATGTEERAGTIVQVSIVLVGVEGESAKLQLPHKWSNFIRGAVTDFDVIMEKDLGDLLLVRISTEQYKTFNMDAWYCRYVDVTSPSGQLYQFPFYQWICGPMTVEIPEGKGEIEFVMKMKGFATCKASWTDIEDIRFLYSLYKSEYSDVVAELWKEDDFFGSQYLIGVNPTLIRKCSKIPENFPVGDNMVAASLGTTTSLQKELEDGNIFLADYKILQGVPANKSVNGKQQYMVAPMCLLWKNPEDQLVPIAIQLAQSPGENAPIFLPSDSESDWLLAKIWVRNSEFQVHQVDSHLLRTHLFAEVFNIATTRQLPMSHPVYKLITPHLLYTLEINVIARMKLIGPGGYFDQSIVTGKGGIPILLKKAMDGVTTRAHFVSNIIHYYYKSDEAVSEDPELQAWVAEIFKEGFLENTSSGVPSSLETKASLIKYLTMVIFTCSAQHAAVNKGQFDFYSWMPNSPTSMKSPPPTAKGISTMQTILEALPDVNVVSVAIFVVWLLSRDSEDSRRLGHYPDVRFTEKSPLQSIEDFKKKLLEISKSITDRNKSMYFPYTYLDPKMIENGIII